MLTVPAYPLLWSSHDVANQHRRRYLPRTLNAAAEAAGWAHLRDTFFNSLLLPPPQPFAWQSDSRTGPSDPSRISRSRRRG